MKTKKAEMAKKSNTEGNFSNYANSTIPATKLGNIKGGDGEATDDFIIIEDIVDL